MKISDASNIYVGSSTATKIMLGTTVIWTKSSPQHDYSQDYLTMKVLSAGDIVFNMPANLSSTITSVSYSTDNGTTWTDTLYDGTAKTITVSVNTGDTVLWKGIAQAYATVSSYSSFESSTSSFDLEGNIMSMLYGDNFIGQTTLHNQLTFNKLFTSTNVVSAKHLILAATNLYSYCYSYLFVNCTSLTEAPELPATTLASNCYQGMFQKCSALTTAPELPATTLASDCYRNMFQQCSSLTVAPILPATILTSNCYRNMFQLCTNLSEVDCRATDISASSCLNDWLSSVSSTGLFKKEYSTTFPSGKSGIPTGWQIYNYNEPLNTPDSVDYNYDKHGSWGNNYLTNGNHYNVSGSLWFGAWGLGVNQPRGTTITYNYVWSFTGDVTLVETETTDPGDPRGDNLPLLYRYTFGGGAATLTLTDPNNSSRVLFTATFN